MCEWCLIVVIFLLVIGLMMVRCSGLIWLVLIWCVDMVGLWVSVR